jgi:hypothetical protein
MIEAQKLYCSKCKRTTYQPIATLDGMIYSTCDICKSEIGWSPLVVTSKQDRVLSAARDV